MPETETPPEGGNPAPPESQDDKGKPEPKPPWESDEKFDPERAWKLIQNKDGDLNKTKTELQELRKKVSEFEDAGKSESEKLQGRASTAEKERDEALGEALRLRVALKKNLTLTQAKRLVGSTEEELEKDADELLADFKGDDKGDDKGGPSRRPTPRLRGGGDPTEEPMETDPAKLAERVPRF